MKYSTFRSVFQRFSYQLSSVKQREQERIVKLFTEAPNFMGTHEGVQTPIFEEEVSTFPLRAATPVPTSPSAVGEVEPPVSEVIAQHNHDNTTRNSTSGKMWKITQRPGDVR